MTAESASTSSDHTQRNDSIKISKTGHNGDEHLPPAEMAAIRDPVR
jgi:hypothetical protein